MRGRLGLGRETEGEEGREKENYLLSSFKGEAMYEGFLGARSRP